MGFPTLTVVTDTDGRIVDVAGDTVTFLDLAPRNALGRNLLHFFDGKRPELLRDVVRASEGIAMARTHRVRPRDRRAFVAHIALDRDNSPDGLGPARVRWRLAIPPAESAT